jgi:hypothetical protein
MKPKFAKSLFVFAALTALGKSTLCACECAKSSTLDKYKSAAVVFVGKVVEVKTVKIVKNEFNGSTQTTFQVIEMLKGKMRKQIGVTACFGFDCCLDKFKIGETVLVYANGEKGKYGTGICSGTTRDPSPETLDQLRQAKIK